MTAHTPGQDPPGQAGQQLAALRAQHPHWDIWAVTTPYDPAPRTWCARPAGAAVATCHGRDPDTLTDAVREFTQHLAAHIAAIRAQLTGTDPLTPAHRAMLEYQLTAMTGLQARTPHPGTQHPPRPATAMTDPPSPRPGTSTPDRSAAKNAAARLAAQLAGQEPGTRIASRERIAAELGIGPTTAQRARELLQGAGIIRKAGRHLYVSARPAAGPQNQSPAPPP